MAERVQITGPTDERYVEILSPKALELLVMDGTLRAGPSPNARARVATKLPITMLLTCDEEVGSPSTRDLIEAEASRHRYVLVPEPARADAGVVTGRYAIARFNLEATGRPSHAGSSPGAGRSAIKEMARKLIEIEDMTTDSCTFSVGVIHGGQWVNCVTTTCTGEALSMAKRQEDLDRGVASRAERAGRGNSASVRVFRFCLMGTMAVTNNVAIAN